MRQTTAFLLIAAFAVPAAAQTPRTFTHADSLRGSFTSPGRSWWDVTFYDLNVRINPADSTVRGSNRISYRVTSAAARSELQVDLMMPLEVDSMLQDGKRVTWRRDGNAFFATVSLARVGEIKTIAVHYHGRPQVAARPPWEGGFSWSTDSLDRTWIVTTDQGLGASVWWPNKDTQADEPDSQRVAITVPEPLSDVSNGRLRSVTRNPDGTRTFEWFVRNPINNYAIAVAAANYTHFSDTIIGEQGKLSLDFWPLDFHLDAAKHQFAQARAMLACFEHWFGPYPWYEDGFKLIEVPNAGMEHQSAIAYGNYYENGYRRRDVSGTGIGLRFDFIIIHESAHEWFGNNITTKDLADMWVHESFANYAENIYVECRLGKQSGAEYVIGSRRNIRNDAPIIATYGVNQQGSGDMYYKGGNMLHTIRQLVNDDEKWRGILRGLNSTFRHQTVMSAQVEEYITRQSGVDLAPVFEQYLRTAKAPVLEYRLEAGTLSYRWADVVTGFNMPVPVSVSATDFTVLRPTGQWQTLSVKLDKPEDVKVDPDYYVLPKNVGAGATGETRR